MKYAIIIPDGAADEPLDELDGKTPMDVARTPNMDAVASAGRLGTTRNVPEGLPAGSDVATLSVLGYDPREFYTGRAPLEAAAQGISVGDDDWIFRCNLVTIVDGVMEDYCAGHISTNEASRIVDLLRQAITTGEPTFHVGVGYRHLMVIAGELDQVETIPPHDILGQVAAEHLPSGPNSEVLREIMARAQALLADCEINKVRSDLNENPATNIWLWGHGKMPSLPTFQQRHGLRGAAITAVDLVRGISRLIDWDVLDVPGATGYLDTNYAGKGTRAVAALDEYDLVLTHVEATDECGHNADVSGKIEALEKIDEHVVGPILHRLRQEGDEWRLLILPDHPTPCRVRTHTRTPSPFAIAGKRIEAVRPGTFCERDAETADLHIDRGCELMEFFLTIR